ncbi:hypothetical protein HDU77_006385 [Chytriomyces hyalinus]|nr:hypothetical protein HDU77_006385 [Chytriomyces hyalinus]
MSNARWDNNNFDDDEDRSPKKMMQPGQPVEKWQRLMRPLFVFLLCLLAVAGVVELSMLIYDQAYAAAGINGALFLLMTVLGGVGAALRRRPFLIGFVAAALVWAAWALFHLLLVLNVIQIGGLSQNTAFMGVANVDYLYPPSKPASATVSAKATATALATTRARDTSAATGTVAVSILTTSTGASIVPSTESAQPATDAAQPIPSPSEAVNVPVSTTSSSNVPVATTTELSPPVRRDDATETATKRLETQTVTATTTLRATSADQSSNGGTMLVVIALSIAYGIQALASIFAAICALLIPTAIPKSSYDSREESMSMSAAGDGAGTDPYEFKRGRAYGQGAAPVGALELASNENGKTLLVPDQSAVVGPVDILSPSTHGRSITAAVASAGRTIPVSSERPGYTNVSGRPPRREIVDSPKSEYPAASSTFEASPYTPPAAGRPADGANRSARLAAPTTVRQGPSAASVAAAAAAGGVAKKYVAGPHNAPAENPALKGRASVYSVYTVASSKNRPDSETLDEDESSKSSGGFATGASKYRGAGRGISTSPVINRADSSKEPKVRCKFCGEKMPLSTSTSHNCPAKPVAKSTAPAVEAKPLLAAPEEPVGRPRRERGASVVASRAREQSRPREEPVMEKLDGKKVKAVKRFVPQMDDELSLEVGDTVFVEESFGDGWAYGTNEITDERGAFPLNSVSRSAKSEKNRVQSIYEMVLSRPFAAYTRFVKRNPLGSQCLVAGLLWCAGDILSQKISHSQQPPNEHKTITGPETSKTNHHIDWKRVGIMSSYGFFIAGPLYTVWYKTLDRVVAPLLTSGLSKLAARNGGGAMTVSKKSMALQVAVAKVAADNFIFEPPYLSLFFLSTHTMSGTPLRESVEHLKADFWPTYVTDVLVWTPIQFINFLFVPVHFQPQFVNAFNIGWNAFLSYVKHEGSHYHAESTSQAVALTGPSE